MMWWSNDSGYGMGWVSWVLMALAMIAFWGLVIACLLALFRPTGSDRSKLRGTNAQRLLDERYARGEIDDDEYRSRREALNKSSHRHESR
ncbi:SHOCT domain-containing protein [Rhodococcus erythropolis]|uniref:SHOCT domain-containing protein n=1 Tax=Rhodococcus erythropolis TaxID=1833 RepID=UPI0029491979|nr:SHOCT domain-containing protein [Rhodococcus erythropolis]MDV6278030.1 SHOCT domain-containing protein [Rhodococcus erythropolis]